MAGEDSRTALAFLEQLRERGLHELALEYLNVLRADPAQPAKIKAILDYEEGRTLIDEAAKSGDLVLREDLLKEAREKLEGFVKANPQLAETREALVRSGQALDRARPPGDALQRGDRRQGQERGQGRRGPRRLHRGTRGLRQGHRSLERGLQEICRLHPRRRPSQGRARPDLRRRSWMPCCKRGSPTTSWPKPFRPARPNGPKSLKEALAQFESLYKSYRTQFAGLAAQMYQAKCYEENGDVNSAIGIYKQLMEHGDPRLRGLQRNVGLLLHRRPVQAQAICPGRRRGQRAG